MIVYIVFMQVKVLLIPLKSLEGSDIVFNPSRVIVQVNEALVNPIDIRREE